MERRAACPWSGRTRSSASHGCTRTSRKTTRKPSASTTHQPRMQFATRPSSTSCPLTRSRRFASWIPTSTGEVLNMRNVFRLNRALFVLAMAALLFQVNALAAGLPTGERALGNATIEPAYNDYDGSVVYLLTPNRLAPLGPNNPINNVNPHAVAPLYLIVYPPGTPGTFNCMGAPGESALPDAITRSRMISAAGLMSLTTLKDSPAHVGVYSMSPSKSGGADPTA